MNRQEAFEKAYKGIVAQGCAARSPHGACLYRGPGNTKCAIGHLLTDEQIVKHNIPEGLGASFLPRSLLEELLPGDIGAPMFFGDLQSVHDGAAHAEGKFIDAFNSRAGAFASNYDLVVPEVAA